MQYFQLIKKHRIPIFSVLILLLCISFYFIKKLNHVEDIFFHSDGNYIESPVEHLIENSLESNAEEHVDDQETEAITENDLSDESIVIDVDGEVKNPSVYILPKGSRIYQAIDAAGGLGNKADTSTVNLAAILNDGTKLYIPRRNEPVPVVQVSVTGDSTNGVKLININSADSNELQKLSGVGPSTAEKILTYRREYGQFNKIEDLMNISGIGEKSFAKLKSQICVN